MGGCGEVTRDGTAQAGSSWVLTAEGPFDAEGDPPSPSPCDSCQSVALSLTPCLSGTGGPQDVWLLKGVRIENLLCKTLVHLLIHSFIRQAFWHGGESVSNFLTKCLPHQAIC